MSLVIEFLQEAKTDTLEARRFYEERVPGLGGRFRSAPKGVCAAIAASSLHWRERKGGFRRVNCPGFPYFIAYCFQTERNLVAAVGHASRHPDDWMRRAH